MHYKYSTPHPPFRGRSILSKWLIDGSALDHQEQHALGPPVPVAALTSASLRNWGSLDKTTPPSATYAH